MTKGFGRHPLLAATFQLERATGRAEGSTNRQADHARTAPKSSLGSRRMSTGSSTLPRSVARGEHQAGPSSFAGFEAPVRFGSGREGQLFHTSWQERANGKKLVHSCCRIDELRGGGGTDREPRQREVTGVDSPDGQFWARAHPGHHHDAPSLGGEVGGELEVVMP